MDEAALAHLVHVAGGDARNALNALELAVETTPPQQPDGTIHLSLEVAQESIQRRAVLYDKDGDAHYDTISAFIKSVRGSDPDAALFWLAKMLQAGESPRFILRRLLILAGEDIGLADPLGLVVANAAAQAFEYVGLPEGIYPIVEATLYLATAHKSNSATAYFEALRCAGDEARSQCRADSPTGLHPGCSGSRPRQRLSVYPHDQRGTMPDSSTFPTACWARTFYQPSRQGYEAAGCLTGWALARRRSGGVPRPPSRS